MAFDDNDTSLDLDVSLALEAAEDAEFAEREFAAELLRKSGRRGKLTVNRYHCKQRWMSRRGFVNLKEMAGYINTKYAARVEKREREAFELQKSIRAERFLSVVSESEGEGEFAVYELPLPPRRKSNRFDAEKKNEPDSRESRKSELLLHGGANCLDPRMLVVSYPGKSRKDLFEILAGMQFECGRNAGDIHIMNESQAENDFEVESIPAEWKEAFEGLPTWRALILHLQGIREIDGSYLYKNGNSAPKWFVQKWGRAAWNAAKKAKITGSGVVIFHSWVGYTWSVWCQLEFLFCKCLVQKFPKSVYVIDDSLFTSKKKPALRGYFMKGTESYY